MSAIDRVFGVALYRLYSTSILSSEYSDTMRLLLTPTYRRIERGSGLFVKRLTS